MFGTFTYRGRKSGADITSPFSPLAKIKDGKIFFVQFLEDKYVWNFGNAWSSPNLIVSRLFEYRRC